MLQNEKVTEVVNMVRELHAAPYAPRRYETDGQSTQYRAAMAAIRVINLEQEIESAKRDAIDDNDAALALLALRAERMARHCRALLIDIDQSVIDNANDHEEE